MQALVQSKPQMGYDANDVQLLMYVFAAKVLTTAAEWASKKFSGGV